MEKINIKDLDFSEMQLLGHQGHNSKIYVLNNVCYKIFNNNFCSDRFHLCIKFDSMNDLHVDGLVLPKQLIVRNGNLVGYTMDYVNGSENMYDYFCKERYVDANDILQATKKASLILEKAHENGLLMCDLSFDNILIDFNRNVKYCDLDGCIYKSNKYSTDYISMLSSTYYSMIGSCPILDENFDRQAMLLSLLATLYSNIVKDMNVYDTLSDKIKSLSDMRFVVEMVLSDSRAQVPYLHEFIQEDDHYIIDRNTQVSPERARNKDYKLY